MVFSRNDIAPFQVPVPQAPQNLGRTSTLSPAIHVVDGFETYRENKEFLES